MKKDLKVFSVLVLAIMAMFLITACPILPEEVSTAYIGNIYYLANFTSTVDSKVVDASGTEFESTLEDSITSSDYPEADITKKIEFVDTSAVTFYEKKSGSWVTSSGTYTADGNKLSGFYTYEGQKHVLVYKPSSDVFTATITEVGDPTESGGYTVTLTTEIVLTYKKTTLDV